MSSAWRAAAVVLLYYVLYIAYLSRHPEGELLHWITLVILPVLLLRFVAERGERPTWSDLMKRIGVADAPSTRGVVAALLVGILLSLLQLAGRNGAIIRDLIHSGRALWLWPLSFVLMIGTAAGTEELFFRGVLQKRLTVALGSRWQAIGVTSVLFAVYHVPYAYHTSGWGVQHDLGGAVRAAMETGLPLGILLGTVFALARESTAASMLAHGMINALPGMVVVQRLLEGRGT